jgi:subtilisin family serine protease
VSTSLWLILAGLAVPSAQDAAFYSAGIRIPLTIDANTAFLPSSNAPVIVSDRLFVRFDASSPTAALLLAFRRQGISVDEIVSRVPLRVVLRVAPGSIHSAVGLASAIYQSGHAEYAVPELHFPMERRSRYVPNDPWFPRQWHLDNTGQGGHVRDADVDAPEAWHYTRGSPDVVIAVLDDGVQVDHPDLEGNISALGADFASLPPSRDPSPKTSADRHGTAVAGVAAARGDNGLGVTGICPRCAILPIRVHGSSNLGTAAAFRYAVEQGADIITNSWGYTRDLPIAADDVVRDAIDEAARNGRGGRGTLVVFGMTNDSVDNCRGPTIDISSLDSVVAVGVSNHNDQLGGSGFGDCMDVVAPSKPKRRTTVGVATTDRTGLDGHSAGAYYESFGGTSAAAPLVAGIAGLLLSLNPSLTRTELERILEHTAEKIDPARAAYDAGGFSAKAGHGRVNAARALLPNAEIEVQPARVEAGEPFSVTITATAPFGIDSVSWFGIDTGIADLDQPRRRTVAGKAFHATTWSGVVIDRPGTFVLGADVQDTRYAGPIATYPHQASRGGHAATASITVLEPIDPAVPGKLR